MNTWTILFSAVLFLGSVNSLPATRQFSASCSLSDARLQVPTNQTQLIPPKFSPSFIALGVGTQNYTCNATSSTYVSVLFHCRWPGPNLYTSLTGAVAELFDSSCLYGTPEFDTAPELVYTAWEASAGLVTPQIGRAHV